MRTLRLNATGDDVKAWQTLLQSLGFYNGALDGKFGPETATATQAFQRAHALADDGVVGNQTLGVAMQLGFAVAQEDAPLPGGPAAGVSFMNDAWVPPDPPSNQSWTTSVDPRVLTDHQPGVLPCPNNPPPPVGWVYWQGNVPPAIGKLASDVEFTPGTYAMGSFVQAVIGTQLVAARVEWHDYQGATGARGCFRGTSLFRPTATV